QAFKEDPDLRKRILNPQTDSDKRIAAAFMQAATGAMGSGDSYNKYVKPLVETGFLSLEIQGKLDKGIVSNEKEGAIKNVANIAQLAIAERAKVQEAEKNGQCVDAPATDERNKILNDKGYQDKALGFLSDDDRAVALAVLKNPDGKIHPEDSIRLKLNHWGG